MRGAPAFRSAAAWMQLRDSAPLRQAAAAVKVCHSERRAKGPESKNLILLTGGILRLRRHQRLPPTCHSEPVTVSLVWESVLPAASLVTRRRKNGLYPEGQTPRQCAHCLAMTGRKEWSGFLLPPVILSERSEPKNLILRTGGILRLRLRLRSG